jgi:hypothetical protein
MVENDEYLVVPFMDATEAPLNPNNSDVELL